LYTSDNDAERRMRRMTLKYAAVSLALIVCAAIYEYFSHGVYSVYMLGMFVIPLVLGVLPSAILSKKRLTPPAGIRHIWNAGIATLTAGSFMAGVFEIYGTASALTMVYPVAGAVLLAAAAAAWLAESGSGSGKHTA